MQTLIIDNHMIVSASDSLSDDLYPDETVVFVNLPGADKYGVLTGADAYNYQTPRRRSTSLHSRVCKRTNNAYNAYNATKARTDAHKNAVGKVCQERGDAVET